MPVDVSPTFKDRLKSNMTKQDEYIGQSLQKLIDKFKSTKKPTERKKRTEDIYLDPKKDNLINTEPTINMWKQFNETQRKRKEEDEYYRKEKEYYRTKIRPTA